MVSCGGGPPRRRCPVAVVPRQRGSGGRQSRATIPFSSMLRFMYFRESKPKFLSPNSFPNSRTVIQITKKCTTFALQCVYSHTHAHTRTWRLHGRSSLADQILWGCKAEKGEVTWPLVTTYGAKFEIGASELSSFKGGAGYLVLVLHLT